MKDKILGVWFLLNLFCFFLYGYDKRQARNGGQRVRERTLLLFSVPGIFGAVLGRRIFHHKTLKTKFRILIPLFLLLELALLLGLLFFFR